MVLPKNPNSNMMVGNVLMTATASGPVPRASMIGTGPIGSMGSTGPYYGATGSVGSVNSTLGMLPILTDELSVQNIVICPRWVNKYFSFQTEVKIKYEYLILRGEKSPSICWLETGISCNIFDPSSSDLILSFVNTFYSLQNIEFSDSEKQDITNFTKHTVLSARHLHMRQAMIVWCSTVEKEDVVKAWDAAIVQSLMSS
ncbi:MAG TPA: hypothetical protein VIE65_13890 [Methylobacter sp.]